MDPNYTFTPTSQLQLPLPPYSTSLLSSPASCFSLSCGCHSPSPSPCRVFSNCRSSAPCPSLSVCGSVCSRGAVRAGGDNSPRQASSRVLWACKSRTTAEPPLSFNSAVACGTTAVRGSCQLSVVQSKHAAMPRAISSCQASRRGPRTNHMLGLEAERGSTSCGWAQVRESTMNR